MLVDFGSSHALTFSGDTVFVTSRDSGTFDLDQGRKLMSVIAGGAVPSDQCPYPRKRHSSARRRGGGIGGPPALDRQHIAMVDGRAHRADESPAEGLNRRKMVDQRMTMR